MKIDPQHVYRFHVRIIFAFAALNLPIALMKALGHSKLLGYSRLMGLEEEANLPTLFSALALGACALVCRAIMRKLDGADPDRSCWTCLAVLFSFMAIDEAAKVHELGNRISEGGRLGDFFYYFGIFLYVPVIIFVALRLFRFWLRQERHWRYSFLLAGVVLVAGAMGCELIENKLLAMGFSSKTGLLHLSFMLEETLEMLGVALFLRTFLTRFAELGGGDLVCCEIIDQREPDDRRQLTVTPERDQLSFPSRPAVASAVVGRQPEVSQAS